MFKHSYSFNDILISPNLSHCYSRKDIDLSTQLTNNIKLHIPIISSPMDTVTEDKMAIQMALKGGLGIIHRYQSIESQCNMVNNVKRHLGFILETPYTIYNNNTINDYIEFTKKYNVYSFIVLNKETNQVIGIITKRDYLINKCDSKSLISEIMTPIEKLIYVHEFNLDNIINLFKTYKIEKIPIIDNNNYLKGLVFFNNIIKIIESKEMSSIDINGKLLVGAAVGIRGDYLERTNALIESGIDILCIDVANGFNIYVKNAIQEIKSKYNIPIMAGNVCNAEGYDFLCNSGADCIRVGVGNGSICSTRLNTGIGNCQFSSLLECAAISKKYNIPMISDGGHLGLDGNKFKALCAGANVVMLGKTLAGTTESPGNIVYKNGKRYKYYRGMASLHANLSKSEKIGEKINASNIEGVEGEIEYKGTVNEILDRLVNNIKSGFSYVGCNNIQELHSTNLVYSVVSSNGVLESDTRIKKI